MENKFKKGQLVVVKFDGAYSTPYKKGEVCKIVKEEKERPYPNVLQVVSTEGKDKLLYWILPRSVELYCESGTKSDGDKLRVDLIDVYAITELAKVLTFGAKKYAPRNWEKGIKYSRCYGAALRHLLAWWDGKKVDEETGLSPLVHAMCEIMFLIRYTKDRKEFDDRPGIIQEYYKGTK